MTPGSTTLSRGDQLVGFYQGRTVISRSCDRSFFGRDKVGQITLCCYLFLL